MIGASKKPTGRGKVRRASAGEPVWGNLSEGDLVVVDSAPLIYMLEDRPPFASLFDGLFRAHEQGTLRIAISTIAVAEVLAGPYKQGEDVLAKRYETALADFEIVDVTRAIAVTAARLRRFGLRLPDALQAATALELGASSLVTHDRDFSRLSGLRVITGAT